MSPGIISIGVFGRCACADSGVNPDSSEVIAERKRKKYTSNGWFVGVAIVKPQFTWLPDPNTRYSVKK